MKNHGILTIVFLLFFAPLLIAQNETLMVRYLPPEEDIGWNSQYYSKLLELALDKTIDTHGPYELVPGDIAMNQRDALKAMMQGKGVDVVFTMTDKTRERVLLPVRVPLVKGLIGARLVMINKEDDRLFRGVANVEDLKEYSFGQGYDWPDTEILKYNDLKVNTAQEYPALFTMLDNGVIDGFPRAVFEIWDEILEHRDQEFALVDGFYIYYPSAMYFFVKKDMRGAELQKRLHTGLMEAIEDGSFDKLFNAQMGEHLKRAKLNERTAIILQNPLLSDDTPLENEALWYLKN